MLQNLIKNIFSLMQFLFLNIREVVRNSSGQESRQKGVYMCISWKNFGNKTVSFS